MNLTFHLVRNDLVRMRAWIACWVGVLLMPIVIGVQVLAKSPFNGTKDWDLQNTFVILAGLQVVVGYILTIVLIHEHRIVGTQQFWLTRPISRGRLLRAKAIGVLVIVGLLPVVVSLPWWLWCGFGAGHIASVAAETLLVMMLAAVPGALMAVLTDSFPRALLWTLVLVAALLFVMLFFTIVNAAMVRSAREMSLVVSRGVVSVVVVAAEMVAIVVVQFLLRRRGWWLGAAAALMVVLIMGSMQWPWPWIPDDPRELNPERATGVTLRFDRAIADPPPQRADRKPGKDVYQRVEAQFVVNGIPKGLELTGVGASLRWDWKGGMSITRAEQLWAGAGPVDALGLHWPVDLEMQRWLAEKLKARSKQPPTPDDVGVEVSAWIQPSLVARMQAESPKFEARLWWRLMRPELRFEIPLEPSRWTTRDGRGLRVEQVEREPDEMTIVVVESRPVLISGILRETAGHGAWFHRFDVEPETTLVAINRGRREVVGYFGSDYVPESPRRVIVNGVDIRWRARTTGGRPVMRDGKWVREPGGTGGDALGVMTSHEEAVFSREVKVERFEMTPAK